MLDHRLILKYGSGGVGQDVVHVSLLWPWYFNCLQSWFLKGGGEYETMQRTRRTKMVVVYWGVETREKGFVKMTIILQV